MNWKITVLSSSGIGSAVLLTWDYIGNYKLCGSQGWGGCVDTLGGFEMVFLPILPLFLFSLITYFMREEVFNLWAKVAIPLALVSMVLIYLTPEQYAGGFGPQLSVGKGDAALASIVLLTIVSIVVIVIGYLRIKKS